MQKKFKEAVDNGDEFSTLFTALSNTFNCIDYSILLPAKLFGYGVLLKSLKLIFWYFESWTHSTNINKCFSTPSKIDYGAPQGSILGPLFFNKNVIDMSYACEDSNIENYADDTTPYTCAPDADTVISKFQSTPDKLFTWFKNNHM